jgi:putative ABC transport system substrate-binding protein
MSTPARRLLAIAAVVLGAAHVHADAANLRIGFLSPVTAEASAIVLAGLRDGLREQGFVDVASVTIEARFADDRFDRLPELARELVGLPVDVLVAYVTQASLAAKKTTDTIPIVMVGVSDPVASGLVASLARPGANITGSSAPFTESAGKALQFLKEAMPGLRRVGVIRNPGNAVFQKQVLEAAQASARQLGIELQLFDARDRDSIDAAFTQIGKQRLAAVYVLPDPVLAANWPHIAAQATKLRLPSVTVSSSYAEAGGLMTYGPSIADAARIAGRQVGKILKGAAPGALPVEQSTKFELVINAGTARQIGFVVPQSLRLRADRLIE